MKKSFSLFATLLICAFFIPAIGQKKAIPIDPSVRMGQLPNGMRYYIQQNKKPENRAEIRLGINAGSMQEDEDQLGLAHFVEHMCFNGSANFDKNELVDYLESIGTKFGADLNAYTSFDETVYMLQVRTDDEEMLTKGLLVMEDWAGGVSFDSEEIDKERGVVISEWRSRLSPDQRMQQQYFPVMYKNSRYAERLPIGKPEIINNASYETVKRFYKDWYRPNLMAISVVGDFDMDWMETEIITRFSKLTNPENPRLRKEYEVPKHKETLVSICTDKEATFTTINLMYKHDNKKTKTQDDYRRVIVQNLYNRMLNARLGEIAQDADPPFTFAYSGYGGDVGNLATYTGYAMVPEGGAQRGLRVILEENKRALSHGFLATELERQKTEMLKFAEKSFKEKDKTDSRRLVMRYIYHYLDDNPIPSPQQTLEMYERFLPTIKIEEINSLAKNWITKENRVVVISGPEKEEAPLPTEDEVLAILNEIDSKKVEAWEDNVSDAPLLANIPKAGKIKSEQQLDAVNVTEILLENGVRIVLKPTDFKNDEILMTAYSPGGTSLYPDEDYPSASNASSIIDQSGIGEFDISQLTKKLTGKTLGVSPYIGELYEGFNGSSSPEDLETFFQLLHLYFTAPRKDEKAMQSFIAKQKAVYSNLMSNPQYWFFDQLSQIKFEKHPRRGFPSAESLDEISLDRVYDIYKERFADASDFTFVFVGNFETEKMKEYLTTYLGSLPALWRNETWKDVNANYAKGKIDKNFSKGKAPKSLIDITFHGDFEWEDNKRYDLNALIQVLRIKMRESMREDKGGVYGVRVSGGANKFPKPGYSINISFNSDPGNVEELINTALKDIAKAKEMGAEEKDLTKVKETQRQERIKNLQENRYWNNSLRSYYQNGFDPNEISLEHLEKLIEGLSSDDIKKAANLYFDENNMIKIVMNPEEEVTN